METNCKQFKKNKDPKCNDQTDCEWVKKRGCLTKEDARALQNTKPTDTQQTDTQPTEEQKSEIIHIQHRETADEAVENYYKLKQKYHNQYLKQKNKILKTDKTNKQKALEFQENILKKLYDDGGLRVENIIEIQYLMELIKYVPEKYKDKQEPIAKCLELIINMANQFLDIYNKQVIQNKDKDKEEN